MHVALLFHHGVRENALNEVTSYPHVELLASNPSERDRLKVLADQLAAFGSVPFWYKDMPANDPSRHGAVLRVAIHERERTP